MDKNGCFRFLKRKFSKFSEAKIKERICLYNFCDVTKMDFPRKKKQIEKN